MRVHKSESFEISKKSSLPWDFLMKIELTVEKYRTSFWCIKHQCNATTLFCTHSHLVTLSLNGSDCKELFLAALKKEIKLTETQFVC